MAVSTLKVGDKQTVDITGWTNGGEGVGRLNDGRAIFIPDTIPGETVVVEITTIKKRFANGEVVNVVEASPDRVEPPCVHYSTCGGCQLQHIAPQRQLELKTRTVKEQLERIGKINNPPVQPTRTPSIWPTAYRNHGRFGASPKGVPGFSQRRTNKVSAIPQCMVLTDHLLQLYKDVGTNWAGIRGLELFTGDNDNDEFCVIYPGKDGVPPAPKKRFGFSLQTIGDPVVMRGPEHIHITITPTRTEAYTLQVSPGAFFQSGPAPAALLVDTVLELADLKPGDTVIDLYSGVGLLTIPIAQTVGQTGHVTGVELSTVGTDDAIVNATKSKLPITLVHDDTLDWLTSVSLHPDTIAIMDPPRAGAGVEVCEELAAQDVNRIVLVSCEIGAMARDVKTLVELGYTLETSVGLDLFAYTSHVEVVSLLTKNPGYTPVVH